MLPEVKGRGNSEMAGKQASAELATLRQITQDDLQRMRKAVTGQAVNSCRKTMARLLRDYPEVVAYFHYFKFVGRGQRETPVLDARGVVQLMMLLPGHAAAGFRMNTAKVLVLYLGGDPSLVEEITANRAAQEVLAEQAPEHPARLFGDAVEEGLGQAVPIAPCLEDERKGLEALLLEAQIRREEAHAKKIGHEHAPNALASLGPGR